MIMLNEQPARQERPMSAVGVINFLATDDVDSVLACWVAPPSRPLQVASGLCPLPRFPSTESSGDAGIGFFRPQRRSSWLQGDAVAKLDGGQTVGPNDLTLAIIAGREGARTFAVGAQCAERTIVEYLRKNP
jgi:hypothetical protein